jgi:glucokinase
LRDVEHIAEKPEVAKLVVAARDPSVVIVNHGLDPTNASQLCAATIDLFVSILAGEAGNLAMKILATGGVYLAGGVAVHTLRAIKEPPFMEHFKRKGRFAELMGRIPIQVVVSPAGLAGAAACGLENSARMPTTVNYVAPHHGLVLSTRRGRQKGFHMNVLVIDVGAYAR